jgi:hypothetical protein
VAKTRQRRKSPAAFEHRSHRAWDRYSVREETKRAMVGDEPAKHGEAEGPLTHADLWINLRLGAFERGRRIYLRWFYGYSPSHEPYVMEVGNLTDVAVRNVALTHMAFNRPGGEEHEWLSLPSDVVDSLRRLSRERGLTVTEFLSQLVNRLSEGLPYGGLIEGDTDLSLKVEEVLARLND